MSGHPTIITDGDTLTRAERERERERDAEMIDDLTRLEGECDDAITLAADLDGLLDLGEAHALMVKAKALVTDARQRLERFQCPPPQSTPPLQYDFWRVI